MRILLASLMLLAGGLHTVATPASARVPRVQPAADSVVTIELLRSVRVRRPVLGREQRATLYGDTIMTLRAGERLQMLRRGLEGGCVLRVRGRDMSVSSCPWLPGFRDPQADVFRVVSTTPVRTASAGRASARKAVFILLDGIPADVIEQVDTPALDEIAAAGGYARAHVGGELGGRTQTPTVSAPGYMSLITGTWADKHNVRGNSNQSPNYDYWNLFRIVETADSTRRTAIFSTWLDNRTVLIGEGRPGAGTFRLDHAVDGLEHDTIAYPHDKASRYILAIDERVSGEAAKYIAERGPDLSWVYLQHTDDAGHAHGDGEAFHAAIRQADQMVGRIWNAVKQRQALGEEWMIVVTTDHGRDPRTGKGHGLQSARERTTWIVTNQRALTPRFTTGQSAIVDIAPSILQHLRLSPPPAVAKNMEGVSFLRVKNDGP